jgi:hypothetical protein
VVPDDGLAIGLHVRVLFQIFPSSYASLSLSPDIHIEGLSCAMYDIILIHLIFSRDPVRLVVANELV